MRFQAIEDLKQAGLCGFVSVENLRNDVSMIPESMGVYMVVRRSASVPEYLAAGTGGFYKGEDPNVLIEALERNWVDGTCVVYIGKAGATGTSATLKRRIRQYIRFGMGKSVGHKGGRYIWQLKDASQLLFCWKPLCGEEPRDVERRLIDEFKQQYGGCRPFANLQD